MLDDAGKMFKGAAVWFPVLFSLMRILNPVVDCANTFCYSGKVEFETRVLTPIEFHELQSQINHTSARAARPTQRGWTDIICKDHSNSV